MAQTPNIGKNHGLVIMSRRPLGDLQEAKFKQNTRLSRKGFVMADLDLGANRLVTVATTQLEDREELKSRQIEDLWNTLRHRRHAGVVLAGDFKTWEDSDSVATLTG